MVMEIVVSVVLLFVGIAVLVLIHVCIVGRAFRRGYDTGQETAPRFSISFGTKTAITNEDLKNLPCFSYRVEEKEGSIAPAECVVCLENFKVGDCCRLLPSCNHTFHAQCVDSWLLKTPICPICRTSVVNCQKIDVILSAQEHGNSTGVSVEVP